MVEVDSQPLVVDAVKNRCEGPKQTLIGNIGIVERRQRQDPAAPGLHCVAGQRHRLRDGGRTGPDYQSISRDAGFDHSVNRSHPLSRAKGGRLTVGPEEDQAVAASFKQAFAELDISR